MTTRIGVDIGGTFTDLVYYDEASGEIHEAKVPTVPDAPEQGVLEAIRLHVPRAVLESAEYFLHGTTVGLNALLERRGATVGLITTRGFRDVLEIRRGDRAEMYNLFWSQPPALVPRRRRLEVDERIRFDGQVLVPFDDGALGGILESFLAEGVDSIAVSLINSYANPVHELAVRDWLLNAGYAGGISLSHEISGEYREYERTSTTVIDAFVRARMSHYLRRLDEQLRAAGFRGTSLITRSGGGSMTFGDAERRPFETIMSGPVGGAQGASELARALDIPTLITADVGGTSFDTALIVDGQPLVLFEGEVDHMPVQTAWVDVRSIGSGGGSIAHVDVGGLMRVGPRSAGAKPGPASYGKGGTEPTMTDAAAVLGMLGSGRLASGIELDVGTAVRALQPIGAAIDRNVEETAIGVMRISAAAMANAMREVTVEQGLDPRELTLLPFGGAGPLMACLLADELGMQRIVIPQLAGNFSAWGLLGADMVESAARTRILPLSPSGLQTASQLLGELHAAMAARSEMQAHKVMKEARLDLRYRGQEHWLSVQVDLPAGAITQSPEAVREQFEVEYRRAFGGTLAEDVEIVAVRATARVALKRRQMVYARGGAAPAQTTSVDAYSFRLRRRVPFKLFDRGRLPATVAGPAVISESTTTLYVDAGWQAAVGSQGQLVMERVEISA